MDLSFYKLRLCDSDLILIDDLSGGGKGRDWARAAREMLQRRRGVGADRFAVISKPEGEIWLRVFLANGEEAPLADAALCAARYLLDSGRSSADSVTLRVSGIDPSGGFLQVDVLDSASLGIALGPPLGMPGGEVLDAEAAGSRAASVETSGERFQVLPLRAGVPAADAAAVFANGGAARARARIGSSKKELSLSAVAVRVASRGELIVSAPTGGKLDSCAAAAVALAASAALGYSDREAVVRLGKGAMWAEWMEGGSLYAAGRPEYVYRGEYHLNEEDYASK
jgi:diaminopimelate epimerase